MYPSISLKIIVIIETNRYINYSLCLCLSNIKNQQLEVIVTVEYRGFLNICLYTLKSWGMPQF